MIASGFQKTCHNSFCCLLSYRLIRRMTNTSHFELLFAAEDLPLLAVKTRLSTRFFPLISEEPSHFDTCGGQPEYWVVLSRAYKFKFAPTANVHSYAGNAPRPQPLSGPNIQTHPHVPTDGIRDSHHRARPCAPLGLPLGFWGNVPVMAVSQGRI